MSQTLSVLCAGAVQGLVKALEAAFTARTGAAIHAQFGAVGAMKDALMSGAPCDVLIVTDAMLRALRDNGAVESEGFTPIGRVHTGVAARAGDPLPCVETAEALKAALLAAPAFYVPDILKSTAGQHIAAMLEALEARRPLGTKLMVYPNGSTAMHELATHGVVGAIGATQVTEILYTPGLALAGTLPDPYGLATVYSAGISKLARRHALAATFVAMLGSADHAALRLAGGFEPLAL